MERVQLPGPRATVTPLALLLVVGLSTLASAQTTRNDWLELRAEKDGQVASLKSAAAPSVGGTVANPLTLVSVRLYTDDSGNQVVVGEVRNDTQTSLNFVKVRFTFLSAGGTVIGSDDTYVWGTSNVRFPLGIYSSVLAPDGIGFFRLWTNLPASQISTYQFASEAETFIFSSPFSAVRLSAPMLLSPNPGGGTDYATTVANDGHMTAYLTRVALAGHQSGSLNDVDFAYVLGSNVAVPCTGANSASGVAPKGSAPASGGFRWPVSNVARHLIEWQEVGVTPPVHTFAAPGGSGSFTAIRGCGWAAQSSAPWINIASGQSSSSSEPGTITYTVAPNGTGAFRRGTITVSGVPFAIEQSATSTPCSYTLNRTTAAVGAAGGTEIVVATASDGGCQATVLSHENWIVVQAGDALRVPAPCSSRSPRIRAARGAAR